MALTTMQPIMKRVEGDVTQILFAPDECDHPTFFRAGDAPTALCPRCNKPRTWRMVWVEK